MTQEHSAGFSRGRRFRAHAFLQVSSHQFGCRVAIPNQKELSDTCVLPTSLKPMRAAERFLVFDQPPHAIGVVESGSEEGVSRAVQNGLMKFAPDLEDLNR